MEPDKINDRLQKIEETKTRLEKKLSKLEEQKNEKYKKVSKFATKLSELRKEREISQKKAASDLGISQALLSHYEKGIRECGLDFVIRCSEYYNVTTDYLLGVSKNRNGIDLEYLNSEEGKNAVGSAISQATRIILDTAGSASESAPAKYVQDYFTLCIYRGALTLAKAGVLPKEMFKFDYSLGRELASAAIALHDAKFVFIEDKSRNGADFLKTTALNQLIKDAEDNILNNLVI